MKILFSLLLATASASSQQQQMMQMNQMMQKMQEQMQAMQQKMSALAVENKELKATIGRKAAPVAAPKASSPKARLPAKKPLAPAAKKQSAHLRSSRRSEKKNYQKYLGMQSWDGIDMVGEKLSAGKWEMEGENIGFYAAIRSDDREYQKAFESMGMKTNKLTIKYGQTFYKMTEPGQDECYIVQLDNGNWYHFNSVKKRLCNLNLGQKYAGQYQDCTTFDEHAQWHKSDDVHFLKLTIQLIETKGDDMNTEYLLNATKGTTDPWAGLKK